MPASRMAVRLAQLPHNVLVELAARLCVSDDSARAAADAVLAKHQPVPQWANEGVLLSSDLVPHLLAPLGLEDGAAAAACSAWAAGWRATAEGRRHLREMPLAFPEDLLGTERIELAVLPGNSAIETRLVVSNTIETRILDRRMHTVRTFEEQWDGISNADAQSIFTAHHVVRRLSHDGLELASYGEEDKWFHCPAPGPGGLLFCVAFEEGDTEHDEILALDAASLQLRYRFGRSLLNDARNLEVVGDELFVCDRNNDRLQVFSLAGEHRRSITGAWKQPVLLCYVHDRLFLVEDPELLPEQGDNALRGRRIFALSLQGRTIEVYTHPVEGRYFCSLYHFDGKLLAAYAPRDGEPVQGMLALAGL